MTRDQKIHFLSVLFVTIAGICIIACIVTWLTRIDMTGCSLEDNKRRCLSARETP
ncbi:MAG: hypothetical protein WC593_14545 [Methanoregula sp.]